MASQASTLLGALLDRFLPSPGRAAERSGRSYAWGPPSRWSQSWQSPDRLTGAPVPQPGDAAPAPAPSAEDVRRAAAAADKVDVTVVGTVPAGSNVVEGVVEEEPARAAGPVDADDADDTDDTDGDPGSAGDPAAPPPAAGGAGGDGTDPWAEHRADGGDVPGAPAPRRLRDDVLAGVAIALVALLGLAAVVYHGAIGDWMTRQRVQQAASAFARAWEGGRLDRVTYDRASSTGGAPVTDADALSAAVARRAGAVTAGLTTRSPDNPSDVSLVGSPVLRRGADGRTATQRARVVWTVDGGRTWAYDTTVTLRERGSRWRVAWSPQIVHPALTADGALLTERVQGARAAILGARDEPLTSTVTVVRVRYATNALIRPRGDIQRLARLTGVSPKALVAKVGSVRRGTTVEVAMLRTGRWRDVSREALRIKGVTATRMTAAVPRTPTYGRALLGEALPATEAAARASGGRVVAGELVGTTGLQRSYDGRLRGTPGQRVVVVPVPDEGTLAPRPVAADASPGGAVLAVLGRPAPGTPVRLTLDARVEAAAQQAVDRAGGRTSLVAVDRRSGRVLAVASNVGEEWDRPLLGAYPPGSTFKIVTTWALTGHGRTVAERYDCPASITVGDNVFRNADRRPHGRASLARQFATSCNTAFAGLGAQVSDRDLQIAAKDLGIGVPAPSLGLGAFSGSVPPTRTTAVHAASLIGQGDVVVSPLSMALTSATIAEGRYRAPTLVLGAGAPAPVTGPTLDPARVATLQSLMCETVRSGTARALRTAPGAAVAGKTGTAQYGEPEPVGAHAWFTGYQRDLAFAVVVERGGSGAGAAVPVARSFLSRVNAGARPAPARSCGPATAALSG
ncbi:penicillin-binding transpeptidase domain-containing protein [Kineosporia sp. A_224]|uniref:penicillin-binding transpeptidase domain-containing protein n=1 Tax=Kineosporia sp. A_224 TaxID=1962180 RepID=UPI000B4B3BBE|nr:penicillin-binding transpeptidase domain-containing protein [Kineosporia sp. A_224]